MQERNRTYDFLIVGAGLYGAVVAHELSESGRRVLVVDKRNHTGGNCYTRNEDGILVHEYGAHIFHTSDDGIWKFVNSVVPFNRFVNTPMAEHNDRLYNLPFNMNTFNAVWGVSTPDDAFRIISEQRAEISGMPTNLEEQAISLVGRDLYEMFIRGYTEKQWGRPCSELPPEIIRRIPVRFTFDNSYFNDTYQGIPEGGYTALADGLLSGCDVRLNTDFLACRGELSDVANHIVFTGPLDAYYDYCLGRLDYRSLRFEHNRYEGCRDFQGVAVVNHVDASVPYTRTVEHKHFNGADTPFTIVSTEYPCAYEEGAEPYYPVNNDSNNRMRDDYMDMSSFDDHVDFGGRLGTYRYMDMDDVVAAAREYADSVVHGVKYRSLCVGASRSNVTVFVVQHKPGELSSAFNDGVNYRQIQAGAAKNEPIPGMLHDTDGNNGSVSEFNWYLNELSAHYWVRHNLDTVDTDYIGFCHYRRKMEFDASKLGHNVVCASPTNFWGQTVYTQYKAYHVVSDLDTFIDELGKRHPELTKGMRYFLDEHSFCVAHLYVMHIDQFKRLWDFMEPCVKLAIELMETKRIDVTGRRPDYVRSVGYVLERMFGYWVWWQTKTGSITLNECKHSMV